MDRLEFETFKDFACEVADKFDDVIKVDAYNDVSIIAKYEEIKEIFKELVCLGYDLCNITLKMVDWGGYDDEYILSISSEGIWIEKFKREKGYFEDESTIIYVLDNCSSKIIPYCKGEIVYEVAVGDNTNDNKDYMIDDKSISEIKYSKDNEGDMHGFTASRSDGNSYYSYSVYTSDKLTTRDIQSLLQEAGF